MLYSCAHMATVGVRGLEWKSMIFWEGRGGNLAHSLFAQGSSQVHELTSESGVELICTGEQTSVVSVSVSELLLLSLWCHTGCKVSPRRNHWFVHVLPRTALSATRYQPSSRISLIVVDVFSWSFEYWFFLLLGKITRISEEVPALGFCVPF